MVHEALEKLFDLDKNDRNITTLHDLLRASWSNNKKTTTNGEMFDTVEDERQWGHECLSLLNNYWDMEDCTSFDPISKEMWVKANITIPDGGNDDVFLVRGIVDRIDKTKSDGSDNIDLRITDYKTGKAPHLKYNEDTNNRIVEEKFWQLKIYALLLKEMQLAKSGGGADTPDVRKLRRKDKFADAEVD